MENNLFKLEIPKKYLDKINRNSTLDVTKSSFSKHINIKLYEKVKPLIEINKNMTNKQKLDFPLFMSLYTNKSAKKVTEETNKSSINRKFILKNIKNYSSNDILKQNHSLIKNELVLPNAQNFNGKNRKENGLTNNANKPLNMNIHNYLNQIKKFEFQQARNLSNPLFKTIDQNKLFKFNQRPNPNIKLFKAKKFELSNIKNTKTYDFEISKINHKKSFFEEIKFTLKKNNNRIIELSNKLQNDNNDIKEDKINNNIIYDHNSAENKQIEGILEKENKNENKKNDNEKEENNEIKKNSTIEKIIQEPITSNKNNKISSIILNKENKNKKTILNLKEQNSLNLHDYLDQKSEGSNTLNSGEEFSTNIKNIYQTNTQNKKAQKVYKKYKFLNKMKEEISNTKHNDKIKSKISLNKEKMITNIKKEIDNMIIKENNKIIWQNNLTLTTQEIQNEMSYYCKEIFTNKNEIIKYKKTYLILLKRKLQFRFNCIIGNVTRDYIYKKYEFNQASLSDKLKNAEPKENNLIKSFKEEHNISNYEKNNIQELNQNNESNIKNSQYIFKIEKSKNIKISYHKTKKSLIFIQEMTLKSLPFYNENYVKFISSLQNKTISKSSNNNISRRKYIMKTKFKFISKQNTLNPKINEKNSIRKRLMKRNSSFLKLGTIRKNLNIQSKQKSEIKGSNFSILEQKDFFNKARPNKENGPVIAVKDSTIPHDKNEVNEIDSQLESIYFKLIKAVYDGKNKFFINFFNQNKKIIDINQIVLEGNTLLLLAVREGNYQITKFLCEENADVNIQNNDGNTALHYAIGKHFYSIADILTMHGAKEDLLNLKGYSPWDCIEHAVE